MVNGTRQQMRSIHGHLSVLTFEQYTLDLADLHRRAGRRDRQLDERYTGDFLGTCAEQEPALAPRRDGRADQRLRAALRARPCGAPGRLPSCPANSTAAARARVLLAVGLALCRVFDLGVEDLATRSLLAIPLLYVNLLMPLASAL